MRESQMPFAAKNESHETLHDHLSTRRDPSSLDDSTVEVVDFIDSPKGSTVHQTRHLKN